MADYRVTYVRVTYDYAHDTIEADSQEAAEAAAAAAVDEGELFLDWQTDDQEYRVLYVEAAVADGAAEGEGSP